jgi:hypothetical protein
MRPETVAGCYNRSRNNLLFIANAILILIGSLKSGNIFQQHHFKNSHYFIVPLNIEVWFKKQRELQGIERVGHEIEIVCFLDDIPFY